MLALAGASMAAVGPLVTHQKPLVAAKGSSGIKHPKEPQTAKATKYLEADRRLGLLIFL